jgi:hypothetical protein
MIVTIHQPEHLVWLGLLNKISQADIFVIFDDTQFKKNYFENRNKIKTAQGWTWLTVPVKSTSLNTKIKDIEISYDRDWQKKYLNTLVMNYSRAPFFKSYFPRIESIILKKHRFIMDLNLELLFLFMELFGIKKKTIKSSELHLPENIEGGSNLCLEICRAIKADMYLAGSSGKDYLKLDCFKKAGIEVVFHEFTHPVYKQLHGDFQPFMSALDALFNLGPDAAKIIV